MSKKISELIELTAIATNDLFEVVDVSANTSKKITWDNLIEDGFITTAKIADDAVTDAKLLYGKLRQRQGGSGIGTDWTTAGTSNYDYTGTNTFIQIGSVLVTGTPTTVTFPVAFNFRPLVFGTVLTQIGANCYFIANPINTTTFGANVITDSGNANTGQQICWIAIGE